MKDNSGWEDHVMSLDSSEVWEEAGKFFEEWMSEGSEAMKAKWDAKTDEEQDMMIELVVDGIHQMERDVADMSPEMQEEFRNAAGQFFSEMDVADAAVLAKAFYVCVLQLLYKDLHNLYIDLIPHLIVYSFAYAYRILEFWTTFSLVFSASQLRMLLQATKTSVMQEHLLTVRNFRRSVTKTFLYKFKSATMPG